MQYIIIEPPGVTNFTLVDRSVFMSWQLRTLPTPDTYFIAVQSNTSSSNVTYAVHVEVPGTANEAQFELFPATAFSIQKYQYCLTAVYGQRASDSVCDSITSPEIETETQNASSYQAALVGGMLGLVTVLLVLLLLLALVYPRCRARMKDKKYLSK